MKISFFSDLWRRQEGVALPTAALFLFTLLIATGTAIDMGRVQLVRTKMQFSVDAACLAMGARASTVDITPEANKFFDANYPAGYMDSKLSPVTVADPNGDKSMLVCSVSGTVPTTLMRLVGKDELSIDVSSHINRTTSSRKGLEISLILDNTGSMFKDGGGGVPKIDLLKSAASTLITTLYGNETTLPDTFVSLVPFNSMVNVGSHPDWMTVNPPPRGWTGCGIDRAQDQTLDTPTGSPGTRFTPDVGTHSVIEGSAYFEKCLGQQVQPLMTGREQILREIGRMSPDSSTRMNIGMLWGWNTLSEKWKGMWTGSQPDRPGDPDPNSLNKVAVLMTDGINEAPDSAGNKIHSPQDDALLRSICANMKSRGITIYTIAFKVDAEFRELGPQTKNLLESCATNPSYFFDAPDGATLTQAFQTIADSLLNLRITQ